MNKKQVKGRLIARLELKPHFRQEGRLINHLAAELKLPEGDNKTAELLCAALTDLVNSGHVRVDMSGKNYVSVTRTDLPYPKTRAKTGDAMPAATTEMPKSDTAIEITNDRDIIRAMKIKLEDLKANLEAMTSELEASHAETMALQSGQKELESLLELAESEATEAKDSLGRSEQQSAALTTRCNQAEADLLAHKKDDTNLAKQLAIAMG